MRKFAKATHAGSARLTPAAKGRKIIGLIKAMADTVVRLTGVMAAVLAAAMDLILAVFLTVNRRKTQITK